MNEKMLNEVTEMLSSINKQEQFNKVKKSLKDMESIIENIESIYSTADKNYIHKRLIDLSYKQLGVYEFITNLSSNGIMAGEDKDANEVSDIIKIQFVSDEKIIITTPFPPMKIGDYRNEISKMFANEITKQLDKNIKATSKDIPIFNRAIVNFEVFIGSDIQNGIVPDADNLDLKNILDSLQPYIIPDDNLLTIDYRVTGYTTNEMSHMKIVIVEKNGK